MPATGRVWADLVVFGTLRGGSAIESRARSRTETVLDRRGVDVTAAVERWRADHGPSASGERTATVGAVADRDAPGTLFAEVSAARVDDDEKAAAEAVLRRVSRFMGLGRQTGFGAEGWTPDVEIRWVDLVDPDLPPAPSVATWRVPGSGALGFFSVDAPTTVFVRAGQGVHGVVNTTAHELCHAQQLKRDGEACYLARFRSGTLEDEARSEGEAWAAFYDRHPDELRRS